MQREESAIVAPAAKVMLVAMLVALARSESKEEPAADPDVPMGEPLLRRLAALSLAELERLAETGALKVVVSCAGRMSSAGACKPSRAGTGAGAARVLRPARGATHAGARALHRLPGTDRRGSQEPSHRAPRPDARSCRARASAKRIVAAWVRSSRVPKTGAPATTPSTARSRATRSRRSTRFSASCRQSGPLRLVRPETGRRPRLFPRREPAGRRACRTTAYCRAPSCPQVTDAERRDSC